MQTQKNIKEDDNKGKLTYNQSSLIGDVAHFVAIPSMDMDGTSPTNVKDDELDSSLIPLEDHGSERLTNMRQLEKSTKMINKPNIMSPRLKNRGSKQMNSSISGSYHNAKLLLLSPTNSFKSSQIGTMGTKYMIGNSSNAKPSFDVKCAYQLD